MACTSTYFRVQNCIVAPEVCGSAGPCDTTKSNRCDGITDADKKCKCGKQPVCSGTTPACHVIADHSVDSKLFTDQAEIDGMQCEVRFCNLS